MIYRVWQPTRGARLRLPLTSSYGRPQPILIGNISRPTTATTHVGNSRSAPRRVYSAGSQPPQQSKNRAWAYGIGGTIVAMVAYGLGRRTAAAKEDAKVGVASVTAKNAKLEEGGDDDQRLFTSTRSTLPLHRVSEVHHDTSPENMAQARAEIAAIIGDAAINDHRDELARHTSSAWSSYAESVDDNPHFVAYPQSTEDVSAIMRICHRRRVPVVAFGGGTSLEGHFANVCRGISLDLSRMDRILTVHDADFDAVVQPGVA